MKIIYFANHGNTGSDDTEGHIFYGLDKLGIEVTRVSEKNPDFVPETGADWLLFHKGGAHLSRVLDKVKYKKVCWYFDKVWNERAHWMKQVIPRVNLMAMTDETFARSQTEPYVKVLRQGIGDRDTRLGVKVKYRGKIAFLGSVYGQRQVWVRAMKQRYGEEFQVYNDAFNRTLYNLCASIPIIVAPRFPSDDYYWSSRIYMTLGSGGFLIHPHLKGLDQEYEAGKHYVGYRDDNEMFAAIDYFLEHDEQRKEIQRAGYEKTINQFTYSARAAELVNFMKNVDQRG